MSAQDNTGPALPIGAKEEQSNSQRKGRKNPQGDSEKNNQKPKGNNQPAVETQELPQPMIFQAMPDDFPTASGPSLPMNTLGLPITVQKPACAAGIKADLCTEAAAERVHRPNGEGGSNTMDDPKSEQPAAKQPEIGKRAPHPPVSLQAMPGDLPTAQGPLRVCAHQGTTCQPDSHDAKLKTGIVDTNHEPRRDENTTVTSAEIVNNQNSFAKQLHAALFKAKATNEIANRQQLPNTNLANQQQMPKMSETHSQAGGIAAFATTQSPCNATRNVGSLPRLPVDGMGGFPTAPIIHPTASGDQVVETIEATEPSAKCSQENEHETKPMQQEGLSKANQQAVCAMSNTPSKSTPYNLPSISSPVTYPPIAFQAKPDDFPTASGPPQPHHGAERANEPAKAESSASFKSQAQTQPHEPQKEFHDDAAFPCSESFTQQLEKDIHEIEQQSRRESSGHDMIPHPVQVFHEDFAHPITIQVDQEATVGSITVAEVALGTMEQPICASSCLGTPIKLADKTSPLQQIFLHNHSRYQPGVESQLPPVLASDTKMPRIQILRNQEAWVAADELNFYLQMINTTGVTQVAPVGIMPQHFLDDELEDLLHNWFSKMIPTNDHSGRIISALCVSYHWFPVVVTPQTGSILIQTTPGGMAWLEIAVRTQGIEYSMAPVSGSILQKFNNDCGFQAVAWLTDAVFNPAFGDPLHRVSPMNEKTAIDWRGIFEQYLINHQLAYTLIAPAEMAFGGAGTADLVQQLVQLLKERGVPEDAANARDDSIIEKLGRQPITRALRATNAWKEIKQLANLATPKLQLVLASEMQSAIQHRLETGQPFGDKKKKLPQEKKPRREVTLEVDDIAIPEGIFKDANQQPLSQIPFQSIGPEARGLVVVSAEQAVPYLRFAQPVSKHGLALIVTNSSSPLVHGSGEEIRFPARCEKTSEPILLTAKIIQLGTLEVTRATPANVTKVDEVNTVVVRVCAYRDELQHMSWDTFCSKPVKHVVDDVGLLQPNSQGVSPIIDIWDRQWLTEKLERSKPADAALFCACFRVETIDLHAFLQHQGRVAHWAAHTWWPITAWRL